MYRKINQLLEKYLGIQFIRVAKLKPLPKSENPGRDNIIVEFIGPPGVGKTTLCDYFLQHNHLTLGKTILTPEDINSFKKGLTINLIEIHKSIFLDKLESLERFKGFDRRFMYIQGYYELLKNDQLITHHLENTIVFYSQHIFQLNIDLAKKLPKNEETRNFLKNRIFIACSADLETVIQRIQKRNKTQKKGRFYKLDDDKIRKKTEQNFKEFEDQTAYLMEKGGQVLRINTTNDLKENMQIIQTYIKAHSLV